MADGIRWCHHLLTCSSHVPATKQAGILSIPQIAHDGGVFASIVYTSFSGETAGCGCTTDPNKSHLSFFLMDSTQFC